MDFMLMCICMLLKMENQANLVTLGQVRETRESHEKLS